MTIAELKKQQLIVLECMSGSKAYGLNTPQSDTDLKGVFVVPRKLFLGLDSLEQVSNVTNDEVYYELGRFIELLAVNNPNILELLASPERCVLQRHPLMEQIRTDLFLSKLCKDTFGQFAVSQIKKARGLNKKMVNPMEEQRKSLLDFCHVNYENGSLPLMRFLEEQGWSQQDCGLTNIPHMKGVFGLYHGKELGYSGIVRKLETTEPALSSIPKGEGQQGLLYFNKDGYSTYCKEHKAYRDWVEKRNDARYQSTMAHGKNYDAKNMMHTFRLLEMAIEIGKTGQINVERPNRDFLLKVKSGAFEYEELLEMAEARKLEMEAAFETSTLPDRPDRKQINQLLIELREQFYKIA